MYKFFVNQEQIAENEVTIIEQDVNHIKNVLRLTIGDNVCICNKETSKSFICKIVSFDNSEVKCEVSEEILETTEPNTYIHIFQGLPKADKMEWIIEKCTEIGAKEITPVVMKRTIVKLDEKDKVKKIDRWRKIAEVAAKQSQRDCIVNVNSVINFQNVFEKTKEYDIVLVAYENETDNTLKNALSHLEREKNNKIAVIIGPEGGIDEQEIELCKKNGGILVTLGKRILRTETAPLVIASNILYELED